MAVRLGDRVVCGEIFNTSYYSVHGWIQLRGRDQPIILQLTGNCEPDLAGRHIRFETPTPDAPPQSDPAEADASDLDFLATQQIGPTGTMTADRRVKVADCPPTELYLRCTLGEPPPIEWKRCLYLEWFSQNGRVVVELPDPVIEFVEEEESRESDKSSPAGSNGCSAAGTDAISAADPSAGDDEPQQTEYLDAEVQDEEPGFDGELDAEDEDPYDLFPGDLLEQFETEARQVDRCLDGREETSQAMYEMELMDNLIESGPGVPLEEIFDGPLKLPRPDQVRDEGEAESALKTLLAQLALFGIALDVCRHYTPREAYRLLVEEICPEQTAYPELRDTQWVQHFMTSEFCPQCEAEAERELEEYDRQQKETPRDDRPAGDPPSGDDIPY
jgi:hypothetical protein